MRSRVAPALLEERYRRARRSRLNHTSPRPSGRLRQIDAGRVVGSGRECFDDAAAALLSFRVHRSAGLDVYPPDAAVADDAVVVLGIGYRRAAIAAPCRIIGRWCERDSAGFRYATLDGHPESGWEEFSVTIGGPGDTVTFTITAESRPASTIGRLLRPVHAFCQDRIIAAYLSAMARAVARS